MHDRGVVLGASTAQSVRIQPVGHHRHRGPGRARSGAAAASLTALSAIRRGDVRCRPRGQDRRQPERRRQAVHGDGRPAAPTSARPAPRPRRTATRRRRAHAPRRNGHGAAPSRWAGTATDCWRSRPGSGSRSDAPVPRTCRSAIRRGNGVAVITSGSRPISELPPGEVVDLHLDSTEPGNEAVGDVRDPHRPTRLPTLELAVADHVRAGPNPATC